jgi:predicted ArsR family transcriptional regulator
MGTSGITHSATLTELDAIGDPAEPVTADELAEELDCDRGTATEKLEELAERARSNPSASARTAGCGG